MMKLIKMWLVQKKNGITYELLQEKDLEQTINCLVDVFTSSEPITTAIKINASEFYPFAEISRYAN